MAEAVADYPALQARLLAEAQAGDVVLGMGARDPQLPRFARNLILALADQATRTDCSLASAPK